MERSEPTLVPEWLRCSGSGSGGGNSVHRFVLSSHSDVRSSENSTRNRSSRSSNDRDSPHSASNSRRSSSSNGSSKHPYGSFSRSHRDRNRDRGGKERSTVGDLWDPLGDILTSSAQEDTLRRSRSLVCRNAGEVLPQRAVYTKDDGSNNPNISNGVVSGGCLVRSIQKTALEKDFRSLGTEGKQGVSDIRRVPSPGLSSSIGNLGLIGNDVWTSALVEVPTIFGSDNMGPSSVQNSVLATPSSGASSPRAGLNMAEALSQVPSRASTTPQLPYKTQRLEELAKKQSRQLVPMTPSMPKALVLSSDKSNPKTAVRANEVMASKSAHQQQQPHSSQLANQVRSDASRPSHAGKFLVLKPLCANGFSSMAKDLSIPTNGAIRVANSQLSTSPVAPSTPLKSPNNSKLSAIEHKVAALAVNLGSSEKKRLSQAKSRSDFFNLMRKKTSTNTSAIKSGEVVEGGSTPVTPRVAENGGDVTSNGDTNEGDKDLCLTGIVYPDEEEAAFLRSLGWEENGGEDDGLTEDEINAFYEEYIKLRPSLKPCGGAAETTNAF